MKQEDINRVRQLFADYAEEHAPSHMRRFADEVAYQNLTIHPIKVCRVVSQFDDRHCHPVSKPYKGEHVDVLTVRSVNVWDYELHTIGNEFVNEEYEFPVAGSHYLQRCGTCDGQGRVICPSCHGVTKVKCDCNDGRVWCETCGGSGKVNCGHCHGGHNKCDSCRGTGKTSEPCSRCRGTGHVSVSRRERESYNHDIGGFRSEVRYRTVTKQYNERCPVCNGTRYTNTGNCRHCGGRGYTDCTYCRGTGKLTCSTCNGDGDLVCSVCGGSGMKTCLTCYGQSPKGTVLCKDCEGSGTQHHFLSITQSLYYDDEESTLASSDFFNRKVAHLPWQEEANSEELLDVSAETLRGDIYHDDAVVNKTLNQMAEKQAQHANPNKHMLSQGAWVTCFYVEEVSYKYKEKDYVGVILGDNLYLEESPITEYVENVADNSKNRIGGLGSAAALKDLEEAMELEVGDQNLLEALWHKAKEHLGKMVKLGEDLFFWPSLLLLTPLVYKFYAVINPVLDYVSVVNDQSWKCYKLLPLTQTVIFVVLYCMARNIIRQESKYQSTYGSHGIVYILVGVGRMLLVATVVFAGLLLLNYLGLCWLTTWVVFIALYVVVLCLWLLFIIWKIIEWLFGVIVSIWNFFF